MQEELGVKGPEIDGVDDCIGAVEKRADGALADAVGEGASDESRVDPRQFSRHRLCLVHADRVHVGCELTVHVGGLELLGIGEPQLPHAQASQEMGCGSADGAAPGDGHDQRADPRLFLGRVHTDVALRDLVVARLHGVSFPLGPVPARLRRRLRPRRKQRRRLRHVASSRSRRASARVREPSRTNAASEVRAAGQGRSNCRSRRHAGDDVRRACIARVTTVVTVRKSRRRPLVVPGGRPPVGKRVLQQGPAEPQ